MLAQLATAVARKDVSPRELIERSLLRIEQLDGELNAVVALRPEAALADADELERALARRERSGADLPLCGLPVLVKDIEDVAGMRTTHGSLALAEASPATTDGLAPARLRGAGAIIVGKSNTPEFAWAGWTANRLFGTTHNPWGTAWTPGGSSGGSGAALAAALAPIATATDGGGSIRCPAAFCGLLGLKPTGGLVPRRPIPPWMDFSTDGPLASSADDLRVLLDVLRGPIDGDPTAVASWTPRPGRLPTRLVALERFAAGEALPPAVESLFWKAVEQVADLLSDHTGRSCTVERLPQGALFPQGDPAVDWHTIAGPEHAHQLGADFIHRHADLLDPGFLAWMQHALAVPMDEYLQARRRRFEHCRRFDELLAGDAVLLSPVLCFPEQQADGRLPGAEAPDVPTDTENIYPANLTGHPALSMPAGRAPSGVPFGLMVTGPRLADDMLIELAARWEMAHPWPRVAPGYEEFDTGLIDRPSAGDLLP